MRQGLVFVHGINQSAEDLAGMEAKITGLLRRNGLLPRFTEGNQQYVLCAKWRSLGSFVPDIQDLGLHGVRRLQAVQDVQDVINRAWETLLSGPPQDVPPRLLVVAHSMGQPIALAALSGLQMKAAQIDPVTGSISISGKKQFPVRTSLLSVGGPLANDDPATDWYFAHWSDLPTSTVRSFIPEKPEAIHEWVDVWNPLDPVAHGPIAGSHKYPGSTHLLFRVPGQPQFTLPGINAIARYHSAYFDYPEIYEEAAHMLDRMLP